MEGEIMTILMVEDWWSRGPPRSHHGLKGKMVVVQGKEAMGVIIIPRSIFTNQEMYYWIMEMLAYLV